MRRVTTCLLLCAMCLGFAARAQAQATLTAVRARGTGPIVGPAAALWRSAAPVRVTMAPQVITVPMKFTVAVPEIRVRAVHNGAWIAFLVEWKDPSKSDRIVVDDFGDQVAIELPIAKGPLPSPMMGNPGGRVNIVLNAADARPYSGALGLENPVSRGRLSPVLDPMAGDTMTCPFAADSRRPPERAARAGP